MHTPSNSLDITFPVDGVDSMLCYPNLPPCQSRGEVGPRHLRLIVRRLVGARLATGIVAATHSLPAGVPLTYCALLRSATFAENSGRTGFPYWGHVKYTFDSFIFAGGPHCLLLNPSQSSLEV